MGDTAIQSNMGVSFYAWGKRNVAKLSKQLLREGCIAKIVCLVSHGNWGYVKRHYQNTQLKNFTQIQLLPARVGPSLIFVYYCNGKVVLNITQKVFDELAYLEITPNGLFNYRSSSRRHFLILHRNLLADYVKGLFFEAKNT